MTFIVILLIALGIFIGYRRGFIRSVFKLVFSILSVVLSFVLAPMVGNLLIANTEWDDNIQEQIATKIEATVRQQVKTELEATTSQYGIPVTQDMIDAAMNTQLSEEQQIDMLNQVDMPENVRNILIQNSEEQATSCSARTFYNYIAGCLAKMIVKAAAYAGTFLLVSLVMFLISLAISIAMRMASLGKLDRIAGALFGGAQMLIYIWILFLVIHMLSGTSVGMRLSDSIESNALLAFLNQHNPLSLFLNRMIAGIL